MANDAAKIKYSLEISRAPDNAHSCCSPRSLQGACPIAEWANTTANPLTTKNRKHPAISREWRQVKSKIDPARISLRQ
jgi:hypothetical protein